MYTNENKKYAYFQNTAKMKISHLFIKIINKPNFSAAKSILIALSLITFTAYAKSVIPNYDSNIYFQSQRC